MERRLTLAELISTWAAAITPEKGAPLIANTPEAAVALADALARLMDDMITRQVPWDNLDKLVPDNLDEYWQQSLKFLKFVHPAWRKILTEKNAIESAARRDKLIEAEANRLAGSDAPVIAAGSTGSMPATAKLLARIAKLPHGALILPGLDTTLDDPSWALIAGNDGDDTHDGLPADGHAQFAMHALLDRIGITRAEVQHLAKPGGREALVSEALRPAATTECWRARLADKDFDADIVRALQELSLIEAANAEEEALAIAVAMREALDKNKTVALVTPDRALARRVVASLARWDVKVDDSGGDALADTCAGLFARLAAEGRKAIVDDVMPAFRTLKRFVETDYLPHARRDLGAVTLPDGAAYYDALVAQRTTTSMAARDIHALGLREVERVGGEMDAAMRRTGFTGTRA